MLNWCCSWKENVEPVLPSLKMQTGIHQTPSHPLCTHMQNAKAENETNARQIRFMPVHVWDPKQHVWDSGSQIIGHNIFNCLQNTTYKAIDFCWAFSCPKRQVGGLAGAGSSAPKPPSILNFLQHMMWWSNVKTDRDIFPSWALRTTGDGGPWRPYASTERCT